jgi:polyisoprenoid-binding protein YceI
MIGIEQSSRAIGMFSDKGLAEARARDQGPAEMGGLVGAWVFDTVHSSINFSVRRLVVGRVRGQFTRWRGSMVWNESSPSESQVLVNIDANSVETNDPDRDAHLRSADFLNVERFPTITFASARVEPSRAGHLAVTGLLSIGGITREVVLDCEYRGKAKDRWGNDRLGFAATTVIERHAFGLVWNEVLPTGEVFVGEEVHISIDIEAMRSPPGRT